MILRRIILLLFLVASTGSLWAQADKTTQSATLLSSTKDSLKGLEVKDAKEVIDTATKKRHIPKIATRRSAIIPGWGQAYNHEYWKIPIVYAALAIPTYTYFYNNSFYKKTRFAYQARYKAAINTNDTTDIAKIDPQLKNLDIYSLQTYRNQFRRDRDYSMLWFFILWGVNIVDATVFAHLKDFDVSNDLSMHIAPTINSIDKLPGVNMVLSLKTPKHGVSSLAR
ncbi:DUF5683 domain-containing protein [Parasediminibacterium sp. JCM 36343]|uniref:DUF5683 domain-containing protein n=1 Tax=Parasediminibacterium sp. JCM 36343 TaxID=3374279 RepID=UPI00397E032A